MPTISPLVPTELLVGVLTEQLDEHEAIERGQRAATAASEDERRRILFSPASTDQAQGPLSQPPFRPCGSPPWHEP